MAERSWRPIKTIKVPEREGCVWTPVLDYLKAGKVYRLEVLPRPAPAEVLPQPPAAAEQAVAAIQPQAPAGDGMAGAPPVDIQLTPDVGEGHIEPVPAAARSAEAAPGLAAGIKLAVVDVPPEVGAEPPPPIPPEPDAQPVAVAVPEVAAQRPLQDQHWCPESTGNCTADGDPNADRTEALLYAGAAVGALLGKVGGSTADLKVENAGVRVFSVGRHCIFSVEANKTGTLYLGVNDTTGCLGRVRGQLEVTLSEAL